MGVLLWKALIKCLDNYNLHFRKSVDIRQFSGIFLCIYTNLKFIFLIFNGFPLKNTSFQTPYER